MRFLSDAAGCLDLVYLLVQTLVLAVQVVSNWGVNYTKCEGFLTGNCYGFLAYFSPVSQVIILHSVF